MYLTDVAGPVSFVNKARALETKGGNALAEPSQLTCLASTSTPELRLRHGENNLWLSRDILFLESRIRMMGH